MKILHIVEDFSINSGGLRTVIKDLNFFLNQNNHNSSILSSKKEPEDEVFIVETTNAWLYSKKWKTFVNDFHQESKIDVIHIHGVWMYPQYSIAKLCNKLQIPFVLSIHGMYEPWLWKKGTLKKKLYFNLLSKKAFFKASYIHAITPTEQINLNKLFNHNHIIEIPNLIQDNNSHPVIYNQNQEKYILYLGRLDEKKGIDLLLNAFSQLKDEKITLQIAGALNEYKNELDRIILARGIKDKVKFLGQVKRDDKIQLIKNAFVLVAPSHSEVIGMVNLEAGILGTPVITTYQTGLNRLWNENGGTLINPIKEELLEALNKSTSITVEERIKRGQKLQKFVSTHYSWSTRYKDWDDLYRSIIINTIDE